jgi:SHS family lactate transporter-like MFS transporter
VTAPLTAQFGIAMGGIWGLAISMSLENMPVECRGLFSGFLQLGYPVGYLIIAAVNLNPTVAQTTGWKLLFYTGAGFSMFAALVRLVLPESQYFLDRRAQQAEHLEESGSGARKSIVFLREVGKMVKTHWARCIFGIIFMT